MSGNSEHAELRRELKEEVSLLRSELRQMRETMSQMQSTMIKIALVAGERAS